MTSEIDPATTAVLPAGRVVCADSVGRTLLAMAAPSAPRRAAVLRRVPVLGRRGELPDGVRRKVLAADAVEEAVPLDSVDQVDAEAVAEWIVGHYAADSYPSVVLGSPHGAALQLAAACGAAWLPTSFTVTLPWPGGSAGNWVVAMAWGTRLAERILEHNAAVTVRQVHDPVLRGSLCGATVSLHIRWRTLPRAYREFLTARIAPGGSSVLVRDLRTWPVLDGPPGYSFQIGTPTGGRPATDYHAGNPDFRRLLASIGVTDWPVPAPFIPRQYAETSGEPSLEPELAGIAAATGTASLRILYTDAQALSAGVADLYRDWLRPLTGARHLLVQTGRMTDPWQVLRGGMVPYWCESASRFVTDATQLWLAGSRPFDRISVLPDPPGTDGDSIATLTQWRSVAAFARRDGRVDTMVAGRYPLLPPAPGHAARYPKDVTEPARRPEPLSAEVAVRHLGRHGSRAGLLVS